MGERPDDRDGEMDVDAVEHAGHLRAIDFGASHPERLDARPLDEVECLLAVLLSDRVTEDGAEQPDVLPHRLGRLPTPPGTPHRADRCERDVRTLSHVSSIDAAHSARMTSRYRPGAANSPRSKFWSLSLDTTSVLRAC